MFEVYSSSEVFKEAGGDFSESIYHVFDDSNHYGFKIHRVIKIVLYSKSIILFYIYFEYAKESIKETTRFKPIK